jgi:hypothetical protein
VRGSSSFNGLTPVRFDGAPGGPLHGDTKWRGVRDITDHGELCRVLSLDPIRFYFDLPSSVRRGGSTMSGAGGKRSGGLINGYVMMAGRSEPVGKLTIVTDGDRFKDVDPLSARDFFDLSHS